MTDTLTATVDTSAIRRISTDLWGIFFEDISSSADGGLASELVQNGAFEYSRADHPDWSNYTAWRKLVPSDSFAHVRHPKPSNRWTEENPHHARIEIRSVAGGPVGPGEHRIRWHVFHAGEIYRFSIWARLYLVKRCRCVCRLVDDDGEPVSDAELSVTSRSWTNMRRRCPSPLRRIRTMVCRRETIGGLSRGRARCGCCSRMPA